MKQRICSHTISTYITQGKGDNNNEGDEKRWWRKSVGEKEDIVFQYYYLKNNHLKSIKSQPYILIQ
jgi:hypothetical protein